VPELPDLTVYLEALARRILGERLLAVEIRSPTLLRSVEPPVRACHGRRVTALRRLGKRIVIGLEGDLFLVLHLMIAGRLHWRKPGSAAGARKALAIFEFERGRLVLNETSSRKRATLFVVEGERALAEHDPGGVEPLDVDLAGFRQALERESHTLKRALSDPRLFAGIGNAYSDEILHRAQLSPVSLTRRLSLEQSERLFTACREVLVEWIERLRAQTGDGFPEKVTAFRPEMAVHGRYREPCPRCGSPVQRIVRAENEVNYCATCQTGGRLLADRALSRLLKQDWPRSLEELERRRRGEGT